MFPGHERPLTEVMMSDLFPSIPKIPFEGPKSDNPLAFKHYEAAKAKDKMRFAMAFWHTMTGGGKDPFGDPTA